MTTRRLPLLLALLLFPSILHAQLFGPTRTIREEPNCPILACVKATEVCLSTKLVHCCDTGTGFFVQCFSGGGGPGFGTIGLGVADISGDTLTITDSPTIDFSTTNDPEDLTGIVKPASIGTDHFDDAADVPVAGECVKVAAVTTQVEYATCAAGGGDNLRVEDGDNLGTFTAMVDADFDDSGDIGFTRAAGPPDVITATIRAARVTDAMLVNNYSGVGACAANTFASTLNDNAAPTCTQPSFTNISGTATKSQIPAAIAYEDEANTFASIGNQVFNDPVNLLPDATNGVTVSAAGLLAKAGTGEVQASRYVGSGSTTNEVDLGTAEAAGTLTVAKGGTNLGASADDNVMVGNGTTWETKALTDCNDVTGKLDYNAGTNTFSCVTDAGGGAGAGLTRIAGASGAAGADLTWQNLTANCTANATTTPAVCMTTTSVGTGTWAFEYLIIYQSSVTTTGVGFSVNHTGTTGAFVSSWFMISTGGTAATGVGDQVSAANAGQMAEGKSERAINTITTASAGVDTISVNMLAVLKGIVVVTATGSLELKHASETANSTQVMANTLLMLHKIQ